MNNYSWEEEQDKRHRRDLLETKDTIYNQSLKQENDFLRDELEYFKRKTKQAENSIKKECLYHDYTPEKKKHVLDTTERSSKKKYDEVPGNSDQKRFNANIEEFRPSNEDYRRLEEEVRRLREMVTKLGSSSNKSPRKARELTPHEMYYDKTEDALERIKVEQEK
jgi:FMN phosphatase YigB (HAD superfamily)